MAAMAAIVKIYYTTIPHDKLKCKLKAIINQCFFHKNGNRRFQYVVIGYKDTYFIRDHSDAPQKYSDADGGHLENLFFTSSPEPKGFLTFN